MGDLFAGLKVIDLSSFIAAPACASIFAEFGADVIKVEPPAGDGIRRNLEVPSSPKAGTNYAWDLWGRNKRSISLNLKDEAQRGALYRLVEKADVLITNFPLAVRDRLGIGYETLRGVNDRLVYASFTGYGETGADGARPGFDGTAYFARCGLMDMIRAGPEYPPARTPHAVGDIAAATALYAATVSALYRRETTGDGAYVMTSLIQNGIWANAMYLQAALAGADVGARPSQRHAHNALDNIYQAADGHWLLMIAPNPDAVWEVFSSALDNALISDDPRFATPELRRENDPVLIQVLIEVFKARDADAWIEALSPTRIPIEVVARGEDVVRDRQAFDAGAFVPAEVDDTGNAFAVSSPFAIRGVRKTKPNRPPELGQHAEEVLAEAGFSKAEISSLLG